MAWLNYQHLYYFRAIAREGGLSRAAKTLHVTHSTLSVQLRALEDQLGESLFDRRSRGLVLTPFGREIQQYADEIFRLGDELIELSRGRTTSLRRFEVGIVGSIPKTLACRLLTPALETPLIAVRVRQAEQDTLLHELASGRLHAVISDAAPARASVLKLHTHELGSSRILLYGAAELAREYRSRFPRSLDGAPMLMPGPEAALRRALERWFAHRRIRVNTVGEIDDAGMLRSLGASGRGLFPVRSALRAEVEDGLGASRVGPLTGLVERYFAISLERRVTHPGVAALIEVARRRLAHAE